MKFSKLPQVTPFFIPTFNLLSSELDNFTFKVLYYIEQNKIVEHMHNTFTVPREKSKNCYFCFFNNEKH